MNRALTFLFLAGLKGRAKQAARNMREPGRLIGTVAFLGGIGFMIFHREHKVFKSLLNGSVLGTLLVLFAIASVVVGIVRRGIAFEPADVEFLFPGPFSERQLLVYRLLPPYLTALIGGPLFTILFGAHLRHPWLGSAVIVLFQIACFHLTTAAALYAGSLSDERYARLRSFAFKALAIVAVVWVLVVTPVRHANWLSGIQPASYTAAALRMMFYPLTPPTPELASVLPLANGFVVGTWSSASWQLVLIALLIAAVGWSWRLALKFKGAFLESSLRTTAHAAETRKHVEQGRSITRTEAAYVSRAAPAWRCFRGAGAIVWKNLVAAKRSPKQIWICLLCIVGTALLALVGLGQPEGASIGLMLGVSNCGFIAFLLQPALRFDLRRDALHLSELRTLPVTPLAFVLAEIATPVLLTLAGQFTALLAVAIIWLPYVLKQSPLLVAKFAMLQVVVFFSVAVVINTLWNIYYLCNARRLRSASPVANSSIMGNLTVVFAVCFHFVPCMWAFMRLQKAGYSVEFAAIVAVGIEITIAALFVALLAALYKRFEFAEATD